MLYSTDKSGKLVLDTKQNFLNSMGPHFENDSEVTRDDVSKSEKILNNHSKSWSNILKLGKNSGNNQPERIKNAMKVTDSDVPPMKGMRKDHKVSTDKVLGPPCRPLSNASIGPNSNLANLMTRVLQPVKQKLNSRLGAEIVSTEELLRKVSDLNSLNKPSLRRLPRSSKLPDIQSDKRTISSTVSILMSSSFE